MLWIVERGFSYDKRYSDVVRTLQRGGVEHIEVSLNAAEDEILHLPEVKNPIAVIGSYSLVRIAKSKNWGPGVFHTESLDYRIWLEKYGVNMLNSDGDVSTLSEVHLDYPRFIRPCEDNKAFTGKVVSPTDLEEWKESTLETGASGDLPVCVAPLKDIQAEYRFFVLDKDILTASRYKLAGKFSPSSFVTPLAQNFAKEMVNLWQPARGFVIDIAETAQGPKIVEINNLNSAGFYECDVSKIIQAIEMMHI